MKAIVYIFCICSVMFAQNYYESGKIDMHGSSYENDYQRKGFANSNMGMSLFLDKNTSKKSIERKGEKKKTK